jgi:hypothetical protein
MIPLIILFFVLFVGLLIVINKFMTPTISTEPTISTTMSTTNITTEQTIQNATTSPETFTGLQGTCRTANNLYPRWTAVNSTTFNTCKTTCLNDNNCYGYAFRPKTAGTPITLSTIGDCQIFNPINGVNSGSTQYVVGTPLVKGDGTTWNCFLSSNNPTST